MDMYSELYDSRIKECMEVYKNVCKVNVFQTDTEGRITCRLSQHEYTYCKFFKKIIGSENICNNFRANLAEKAFKFGEAIMLYCPAEVIPWINPIIANDKIVGMLVGGPILLYRPDNYMFVKLKARYNIHENDLDQLKKYILEIPVIDVKSARYYVELLNIVSQYISKKTNSLYQEKREFYRQQAQISEEIYEIKDINKSITEYYSVDKERLLIEKVKTGDYMGAKMILNEMIGLILFKSGRNFEYIKARVLELIVVLSRAAVEGGGNLEMIFGMNCNYFKDINKMTDVNQLSFWLIKILDNFMECVGKNNNLHLTSGIIRKSIMYLKENYKNPISLEEVSQVVHHNPSYFSKLFKSETGENFIDYLNKIRVEESKKYLLCLDMKIVDVALNAGFCDQSYYTRVFKKVTGIPPGKWRKINVG